VKWRGSQTVDGSGDASDGNAQLVLLCGMAGIHIMTHMLVHIHLCYSLARCPDFDMEGDSSQQGPRAQETSQPQ
jgi:hypothetical protein